MKDKLPCGCVHDGYQWLKLCPEHEAEEALLHAQAARDHALEQALFNNGDWLG